MTKDVILEVTADFVRSSETNLKLALQVERAMPYVREHFVRAALEAVEECFPRSEWHIDRSEMQDVMARYAHLRLRSKAWKTQQSEAYICLGSGKPDWKQVWIGLYFTGRFSQRVRKDEQMVASLTNKNKKKFTFEALEDEVGVYRYLNEDGELGDWSGEQFLTRMIPKDGPGRIAIEISAELKEIDKFVRSLD